MTAALKRVLAMGLVSHVLAFSTFFTILSGMFPNGTDYLFCFFVTAVVLAAVVYAGALSGSAQQSRLLALGGTVVLLLGFAALFLLKQVGGGVAFLLEAFFAVVGFFLLRRMVQMVADLKYVRDLLLGQYKFDVVLAILFSLFVVLFISPDPAWQSRMLPFFAGFLLTRMVALSLASQLNKEQNMRKTMIEKFQRRAPVFLIAAGLMFIWILRSIGGTVWRVAITPVVDLLTLVGNVLAVHGSLPGWLHRLIAVIQAFFLRLFCWMNKGMCANEAPAPGKSIDLSKQMPSAVDGMNLMWLKLLFGVGLAALLVWYLFRTIRRAGQMRTAEGVVEVREFLHRTADRKQVARARLESGSLSPMRKAYRKFLLAMQKTGFARHAGETASELVGKVSHVHPDRTAEMEELTDIYMRERYGGQSVEEKVPRAEQLVQELTARREKN